MFNFKEDMKTLIDYGTNVYMDMIESDRMAVVSAPRSKDWPRVSKAWLAKNNKCAMCGVSTFLEVHHKLPFHLFPEFELDERNFMTLCMYPQHFCHFVFGHHWNWKYYNRAIDQTINFINLIRMPNENC